MRRKTRRELVAELAEAHGVNALLRRKITRLEVTLIRARDLINANVGDVTTYDNLWRPSDGEGWA